MSDWPFPVSREETLDRRRSVLIGKLLDETATDADREELAHVIRERADLMLPRRLRRPASTAAPPVPR